MTEKKFVHYVGTPTFVGDAALLQPIDHPSPSVTNGGWVTTSPVVKYDKLSGRLETANTIYVRDIPA